MKNAFIIVAVILFVLAAFGVAGPVALVPIGLAFWAASNLL